MFYLLFFVSSSQTILPSSSTSTQHSHYNNLFLHPPCTITMAATTVTTGPIIMGNISLPIFSNRLIIRSFRLSDLEAYHTLLSQPEATEGLGLFTSPNLSYTEVDLNQKLPPYDSSIDLGIFLKKPDGSEDDLIGFGGMCDLRSQDRFPLLFYGFKKECWNKGYATEFVTAFMQFWWSMPREPKNMSFEVTPSAGGEIEERVCAAVKRDNVASKMVLEKAGFEMLDDDNTSDLLFVFFLSWN
jgi:RimJ/RimL family protein N-acetyltransferase